MHSFSSSSQPTTNQPPKSARVLILDDERFDRHRLQRLSSGLPVAMEVATADSLATLAPLLESANFDLIFVDFNLPDGSGLDALDMIRLCPRNCTAATVMVSGFNQIDVIEKARAGGCFQFLSKDDLSSTNFAKAVALAL